MAIKETKGQLICPFCGKSCKNLHGLKMHVILKAKYGCDKHMICRGDDFDITTSGKLKYKCLCGSWMVLNSERQDVRIKDEVSCLFCEDGDMSVA